MATRQHGIYLFNITKKPKVVYDVICAFYQNARIIRRIVQLVVHKNNLAQGFVFVQSVSSFSNSLDISFYGLWCHYSCILLWYLVFYLKLQAHVFLPASNSEQELRIANLVCLYRIVIDVLKNGMR